MAEIKQVNSAVT